MLFLYIKIEEMRPFLFEAAVYTTIPRYRSCLKLGTE